MSSLSLKHIYKVYPNGAKAVNDFSLEIEDKEFVVFVGPSGCGKSTTLRMIAGLEDITAGELYIDNRFVNTVEPKDRDIAMVFQNYALYPHLTVYENIAFGLKLRHVDKKTIDEKVQNAANMLGLTEYLKRKPGAMSGGQRQRVALGRALVREPKVFLLDEPLSNLDAKLRASMRSEISKLHKKLQTTFIYVTHDQVEAMTMGDKIVVMKAGVIQQVASPKDLYRYPENKFVAGFIGTPQMNFWDVLLNDKKNKINIKFENIDLDIDIPRELIYKLDRTYFDGVKKVTLGLRCESISIDPKQFPFSCKCRISQLEELGTETLVHADLDVNADVFALGEDSNVSSTSITIKAGSNYFAKVGDIIDVSLNFADAHFFDRETEVIINPRVPLLSRVKVNAKDKILHFGKHPIEVPEALFLEDGDYDLVIPTDSIKLGKHVPVKIISKEQVKGINVYLAKFDDDIVTFKENKDLKVGEEVWLDLDLKCVTFTKKDDVILNALNLVNVLKGEVYYHKNKEIDPTTNKKVKKIYLDYMFGGSKFICTKEAAYRTFIETKNKEFFDIDIDFKFSPYDIYLKEDGPLTGEVVQILDYKQELFAKAIIDKQEIYCSVKDKIEPGTYHFDIDINNVDAYDKEKDIKLA